MTSAEAIKEILSITGSERTRISLQTSGEFDFFVHLDANTSIYAFNYELDGFGIGIRQNQKHRSSFWGLDAFGVPEDTATAGDLVRVFLEVYKGARWFKILNDHAMTRWVFRDERYPDLSIYELINKCKDFSQ